MVSHVASIVLVIDQPRNSSVRGYILGGELEGGYGRTEESTAELVAQRPAGETDDEGGSEGQERDEEFGLPEESRHYRLSSSVRSAELASTAISILYIPMIARATPSRVPTRVKTGLLSSQLSSQKPPIAPAEMQMATYHPTPSNRSTMAVLFEFMGSPPSRLCSISQSKNRANFRPAPDRRVRRQPAQNKRNPALFGRGPLVS